MTITRPDAPAPGSAGLGPDLLDGWRDDANAWDAAGLLPDDVRQAVGRAGLLGADVPVEYGGLGLGPAQLGELAAAVGGVCSSLRGLLTVQTMVAAALLRWGTDDQRADWLPALAGGRALAGFAVTEDGAGTDLAAVRTRIEATGARVRVSGEKRWVTFGELADVYLVLGVTAGLPAAVLVEADRPGVIRQPVRGQLGMRAAHLAHVRFDGVRVPAANLVAPAGFGLSHVTGTALDHGRFTVAWGCVGMAEACLDQAARHAATRMQGATRLADHQVVRSLLGQAVAGTAGARQLCLRAAASRAEGAPAALTETVTAKYAAATNAVAVTGAAVQILGASGCAPESLAGRFFRDAKVMEIIEGSAQVCELRLADQLLRRYAVGPAATVPPRGGGPR